MRDVEEPKLVGEQITSLTMACRTDLACSSKLDSSEGDE